MVDRNMNQCQASKFSTLIGKTDSQAVLRNSTFWLLHQVGVHNPRNLKCRNRKLPPYRTEPGKDSTWLKPVSKPASRKAHARCGWRPIQIFSCCRYCSVKELSFVSRTPRDRASFRTDFAILSLSLLVPLRRIRTSSTVQAAVRRP